MHTSFGPSFVRTAVAVLAAATLALTAAPAVGAPTAPSSGTMVRLAPATKIGPVKNLALSITKPASYRVQATWDALPEATQYRVSLLDGAGTVLTSARVATAGWTVSYALAPGTKATVRVVPMKGKRPGVAASVSAVVPDLTAPVGKYTLEQVDRTVTVTELSLTDDVTAADAIVRTVDWGDDAGFVAWESGTAVEHVYPEGQRVYHPRVRLADAAGNVSTVALPAVAIDDFEAPRGSFSVQPQRAWARYTYVTVTQLELDDDVSLPENIRRVVDWQDGNAPRAWTTGTTLRHRYSVAGDFTPTVTLTDEAGRETVHPLVPVVVSTDTVKPTVTIAKPRVRRNAVRSWTSPSGKARDVKGSGVRNVRVRAVQKRNGTWFAYRAPARTWVRAGSQAAAVRKSRAAVVRPVSNTWSSRLRGLRKGTLVLQVRARDNVGNLSSKVVHRQELTRR